MVFYKDRYRAGEVLAEKLLSYKGSRAIVFGIPRGGVITAAPIAKKLGVPMDVAVVRKLPIPYNPEAGFGAVAPDGQLILNEDYLLDLNLSQEEIKNITREVLDEMNRRLKVYRGNKLFPNIKNKVVIVVDDGLATGYTMIAALKYLKTLNPKKLICAVPISSPEAIAEVKKYTDEVVCDHVSENEPFAVASFYQEFPEVKDDEVLQYLKKD